MRARIAEPLFLALAVAGLAPAANSQEGGGTEKEPVDPRRRMIDNGYLSEDGTP